MRIWESQQGENSSSRRRYYRSEKPLLSETTSMGERSFINFDGYNWLFNKDTIMMAKKYEWLKTLKKFGIAAVEVVVAGFLVYLTDNQIYLGIVPVLEALRNYLKHG